MTKKHDIIWLNTVDSTNNEAGRHISGLDNLSVLSAFEQTDGRGQRGNRWTTEAGVNLTFSIVLKYGSGIGNMPQVRACDQFVISEIAALSVTDLLAAHDVEAKVKWPNDIYVGDRKICGILIENSLRGAFLSSSIIGIGLNVNQVNFSPELPNPTSMLLCRSASHIDSSGLHQRQNAEALPLDRLLEEFMDIFKGYCHRYMNITGGYARLRKLYLSQMWRSGQTSRFMDRTLGKEFTGCIEGLSTTGQLLVRDTENGELKEFAFREIGYIL